MTNDKLGLRAELEHVAVPPLDMGAILRRGNTLLRRRRVIAAFTSGAIVSLVVAGGVAVLDAVNQPSETPVRPAGETPAEAPVSLTVFLKDGLAPQGLRRYVEKFAEIGGITNFEFVSKREAFARFKQRYEGQPEYWENLPQDALPAYFILRLSDRGDMSRVIARLEDLPGVDEVHIGVESPNFDEATADAYRLVVQERSMRVFAPGRGQRYGWCPTHAQQLGGMDLPEAEDAVLLAKDEISAGLDTGDAYTDSVLASDRPRPPDFARMISKDCSPSLVERTALVTLHLPQVDSASMGAATYFVSREPRGWVIWNVW